MANGKNYTVQSGDTLSKIVANNPDLGYSSWQELRNANIEEIRRVGREQMAAAGIGPDVTRLKHCGLTWHTDQIYSKHYIENGIHYDEPGVPTIYPDTTLFLRRKPGLEAQETQQIQQNTSTNTPARVFRKRWTGIEHQSPAPKIEIFINGDGMNPNRPDVTYSPDPMAGAWAKLLSYTFTESTDDLQGAFSFSVENVDNEDSSVLDRFTIRSVVKIYEGDPQNPAFVGIIRRPHFGSSMTGQGVKRSIVFSGKSIISCITEYTLSLDVRIQGVADAMSRNIDLTVQLARDGLTIKDFMKETWEHFENVSKSAGISTAGIADIISKFIGGGPETFVKVTGQGQTLRYNVACVFYNAANNVIADVWRNILPEKVYEFFSRCEDGEPRIVARQVPFEPGDWSSLDLYEISPISLTAQELDRSDEEVYTVFASYIIGSAMSKEFYMATNQTSNDSIVEYDREKQRIYGFKPLELIFNGYDKQGNANDADKPKLSDALKKLNQMAKYWYSRLDEMYSGSITVITDFNEPETNPRIGCRAGFIGGEFYIEKAVHSWSFGGTPTIKLTLSRGMIYDADGKMVDGKDGVLRNVGSRYRELEKETA